MIDDLNRFMHTARLPAEMARRLREYFFQTRHLRESQKHQMLLETMSGSLQAEVAWTVNEQWLNNVHFLRGSSHGFMVQLALQLHPLVFAPGELCPSGLLYIVHRGLALYGGKLLGSGKVWGEDMILASVHLQSKYCARALNFLEVRLSVYFPSPSVTARYSPLLSVAIPRRQVHSIDREELAMIASAFPDDQKRIRSSAIRCAAISRTISPIHRRSQEIA